MPISSLFFEINQSVPNSTTSHPQLTHWHFTKILKTTSNHFNTSQSKGQRINTILCHTSFSSQFPIISISKSTIIIHDQHHTHHQHGITHQFNLNHPSSIYHNMHFLTYHTIKASIFIITHMITSYISTIPQHHQFNAYLRASSLSISYHITY